MHFAPVRVSSVIWPDLSRFLYFGRRTILVSSGKDLGRIWDGSGKDLGRISMDFNGFQWISKTSMDFNGFQWISTDFNGFQWISMDSNGFQWISMDSNAFQGILNDSGGSKSTPPHAARKIAIFLNVLAIRVSLF